MAQPQTKYKCILPGELSQAGRKPRRKSYGNDNDRTPMSHLPFRVQKLVQRRAADLDWQIKFAQMKLTHWHNPDADHWTPLSYMLENAASERAELGPVQDYIPA